MKPDPKNPFQGRVDKYGEPNGLTPAQLQKSIKQLQVLTLELAKGTYEYRQSGGLCQEAVIIALPDEAEFDRLFDTLGNPICRWALFYLGRVLSLSSTELLGLISRHTRRVSQQSLNTQMGNLVRDKYVGVVLDENNSHQKVYQLLSNPYLRLYHHITYSLRGPDDD